MSRHATARRTDSTLGGGSPIIRDSSERLEGGSMSRWLSALLGGVILVAIAVVFWTTRNRTNVTPPAVSPGPTPVAPAPVPQEAAPSPPPPAAAAAPATPSLCDFAIPAAAQSDQQPTRA